MKPPLIITSSNGLKSLCTVNCQFGANESVLCCQSKFTMAHSTQHSLPLCQAENWLGRGPIALHEIMTLHKMRIMLENCLRIEKGHDCINPFFHALSIRFASMCGMSSSQHFTVTMHKMRILLDHCLRIGRGHNSKILFSCLEHSFCFDVWHVIMTNTSP